MILKKGKKVKKMFIGGLLGSAAGEIGGALGKSAIARVVGGKGAGKEFLENEFLPSEEAVSEGSGITIKITKDGNIVQEAKKGAKIKKKKKKGGGMANLSAAQKEVYRRGLAAYMSSGNRPKVSQHAWAMARVKSAFGKREAAKIRAGKGKQKKK